MKSGDNLSYNYLEEYLDEIQSNGRYAFTWEEIRERFDISDKALQQSLYRLKSKQKIVQVRKGFYTVLPPEYSRQGIIPSTLFMDDMMAALNRKYYVGLISAAAIHGAAHQQPMETFIIIEKPAMRNIDNQKMKINFSVKKSWDIKDITEVKTDAGYLKVSSPELTALDLIYYVDQLGMNRIITVLEELTEVLKPNKLYNAAQRFPQRATVRRLGYLLENTFGKVELASKLHKIISAKKGNDIPLVPGKTNKKTSDSRWGININTVIEGDL